MDHLMTWGDLARQWRRNVWEWRVLAVLCALAMVMFLSLGGWWTLGALGFLWLSIRAVRSSRHCRDRAAYCEARAAGEASDA